jgi:hypothetical protein
MSSEQYTIAAYVIGLGLMLGYAVMLFVESRATARRQRKAEGRQ